MSKNINSVKVYMITDDSGRFMHRIKHDCYQWRVDVSPYTVCLFKHIDNAFRAISRSGMEGKPTEVVISFEKVERD